MSVVFDDAPAIVAKLRGGRRDGAERRNARHASALLSPGRAAAAEPVILGKGKHRYQRIDRVAAGRDSGPSRNEDDRRGPRQFIAPHGIAVDSRGDIYVAEVANTYWPVLFGKKPDYELRCFQKLVRVS